MDSNIVEHDMLSKQTDPAVLDSVASDAKAIRKKPDGNETATNTTSLDQVVVNATTDTSSPVGQDVSLVNVSDYIDNTPLTQEAGHGNVSYHVDHHDTIPDPVLQSAEAGITSIDEAMDDASDAQQAHGQQADASSHLSGLDVHIPRSNLPCRRDSDVH
jgi:hypothetical protein